MVDEDDTYYPLISLKFTGFTIHGVVAETYVFDATVLVCEPSIFNGVPSDYQPVCVHGRHPAQSLFPQSLFLFMLYLFFNWKKHLAPVPHLKLTLVLSQPDSKAPSTGMLSEEAKLNVV